MSIEIIHHDDQMVTGYINVPGSATTFPGIAVKRKKTLIGIAFNDKKKIEEAIMFLKRAKKELYG